MNNQGQLNGMGNSINNQGQMQMSNNYNMSKNHFFIGYKLSNNFSKKLKKIQNNFLKNYKINNVKKIIKFHLRFVYLGYVSEQTAVEFYNYLKPLLEAVAQKFKPLQCDVCGLSYKSRRSKYDKIVIKFKNEYLNLINDYLKKNGTDKIFGDSSARISDLHINILTFKKKDNLDIINNIKEGIKKFRIQDDLHFTINSLDLLKGEPTETRKGHPSKNDEMFIQKQENMSIPFSGQL